MAKGNNNLAGKRPSSHSMKPYDANNSFVKKMATKVSDFIPQRSWISKWFNTSQGNGDVANESENPEDTEPEEDIQKPPPSKRPRIRMDVTHPPGTFFIQPRMKPSIDKVDPSKEQYAIHNETPEDFLEPASAGPSGLNRLISSTPATQTDIRNIASQRSELNSLVSVSTNGATNGMDDNSESSESTSGCSSLIPQTNRQEAPSSMTYSSPFISRKRFIEDKLNFTNHLQSPRSLFLDNNTRDTLSSRRPSFNASVMANVTDRTSLSSPFYSGNITFGGANAAGLYKRSRTILNNSNEFQLKVPRRTNVEVKPSDPVGVDSSGMSQTAKKILEALEHFSSPISDAKRIPLKSTNTTLTPLTTKKRSREESESPSVRVGLRHLTRELTVPTVPDILKLRRRQKLQDTTVAARKLVSARSEPPPPQEYHFRSDNDDNVKYHGKLKAKSKTNIDEEDTIKNVNLPNIPLPISSLPNFNFTPSQCSTATSKSVENVDDTFKFASPIKVTDSTKCLKSINNFTFSAPINAENTQELNNSNQASKTVHPENVCTTSSTSTASVPNFLWSNSSTAPRLKEKIKDKTHTTEGVAVANELKSGSVMDILCDNSKKTCTSTSMELTTLDTEKEAIDKKMNETVSSDLERNNSNAALDNDSQRTTAATWECSECFIKNSNSGTKCVACKAPRSKCNTNNKPQSVPETHNITAETKPVKDCFGSQFKLSSNQCESCTRNQQSDDKCVTCHPLKASNNGVAPLTTPEIVKPINSNLMDKFKFAEGSWECPGCMLRNAATVLTCPCCSASKPNMLKISPKRNKNEITDTTVMPKQETNMSAAGTSSSDTSQTSTEITQNKDKDTWGCTSCSTRNPNAENICSSCNTAKLNTENRRENVKELPNNGFGDKFKKPEGSWCCDSCMLQNDAKVTICVACESVRPGSKKPDVSSITSGPNVQFKAGITSNTSSFKFGIDKAGDQFKTNTSTSNGFSFGNSQSNNNTAQFTFGIPKSESKVISETNESVANPLLSSTKNTSTAQFNLKEHEQIGSDKKSNEENKGTIMPFSFGTPKTGVAALSNKVTDTPSTVTTTSGFNFGVPKPEGNQLVTNNTTVQTTTFGNNTAELPKQNVITTTSADANVISASLPLTTQTNTLAKTKATPQTTAIPSFGQTTTSTSTPLSNTFSFTANKTVNVIPPSAAKNPVAVSTNSSAPIFSNVSNTTPLFGSTETKTVPAFGAAGESKPTAIFSAAGENKPTAAFSAAGENKSMAFGTGNSKPSTFGLPDSKPPGFADAENKSSIFGTSETKVPVFGNTEKASSIFNAPISAPISAPINAPISASINAPINASINAPSEVCLMTPTAPFGSSSTTTPLFGSSTTTVFGNNTTSTFGTGSTPNIFSTTKPNENATPNPSLFTFGATSASTQQSGNGFNFAMNTNPTGSAQKPLFAFGSNSNNQQTNNLFGGGTFNSPASNSNTNFTFNASKPETPGFGQSAVTTPIFGATQTNPPPVQQSTPVPPFSSTTSNNAGFNFGSSSTTVTPSGGFNFGGMASTSASTEGFNFNPPSSTSTVSFDPNTRLSYNFTGGAATTFNATPQSTVRKIKKAVRRMR